MENGQRLKDKVYEPDEAYDANDVAGQPASARRRITRNEAYDLARKEFYELRHREQVEQRIAHEEATYVGAYFGKLRLDVSMQIEDQVHHAWLKWADKELLAMDAASRMGGVPQQQPPPPRPPTADSQNKPDADKASRSPKAPGPPRATLRTPTMGV